MILPKYMFLITFMEMLLSENEMEVLNDAIQCYGRHPEDHSYAGEMDDIRNLAQAFKQRGYNHVRPEFDILIPKSKPSEGQKE